MLVCAAFGTRRQPCHGHVGRGGVPAELPRARSWGWDRQRQARPSRKSVTASEVRRTRPLRSTGAS